MTTDPWSLFLAAPDNVPRHRLIAAVKTAYILHEPTKTANGFALCPFCTRSYGVFVAAPCDAVQRILDALTTETDGEDTDD